MPPVIMSYKIPSNITHVFWDWHGVLGLKNFWHQSVKSNTEIQRFANYAFASTERVDSWMRNQQTIGDVILNSGAAVTSELLVKTLLRDWSNTKEVIDTQLFLSTKNNTGHARHYIITDNMDIFDSFLASNDFVTQNFAQVFNSARIGKLKKDSPGLFHYVLDNLQLASFQNTLLIDDSPANCQHFEALGGQAILHPRQQS